MRELLLAVMIAATLVFGYILMARLDRFLGQGGSRETGRSGERLRIGFSDPAAADGIAGVLEAYSARHPHTAVRLLSGTQQELTQALSGGRVDIIFLPDGGSFAFPSRLVLLERTPGTMQYGGLSIEPMDKGPLAQRVLWVPAAGMPVQEFLQCLPAAARQ